MACDATKAVNSDVELSSISTREKEASESDHNAVKQLLAERKHETSQTIYGMVLVLISTLLFSAGNVFIKIVGQSVPLLQIVSIRFWFQGSVALILIAATRRGKLQHASTWLGMRGNGWKLFLRGAFGISSLTLWFFSLQTMPLADATAINYLNIPFTAILATLLLKEPYSWLDGATTVICMFGVVLVVQPTFIFHDEDVSTPLVPTICTLLSALLAASAMIAIRAIGPLEDSLVIVLWFGAIGAITAPTLMFLSQQEWVAVEEKGRWLISGMCVTGWAGQLMMNRGYQIAAAGPLSIIKFCDIVVAVVVQTLVLNKPTTAVKLLGCCCVASTVAATFAKMVFRRRQDAEAASAAAAAADADADRGGEGPSSSSAGASPPRAGAGRYAAAAAGGGGGGISWALGQLRRLVPLWPDSDNQRAWSRL